MGLHTLVIPQRFHCKLRGRSTTPISLNPRRRSLCTSFSLHATKIKHRVVHHIIERVAQSENSKFSNLALISDTTSNRKQSTSVRQYKVRIWWMWVGFWCLGQTKGWRIRTRPQESDLILGFRAKCVCVFRRRRFALTEWHNDECSFELKHCVMMLWVVVSGIHIWAATTNDNDDDATQQPRWIPRTLRVNNGPSRVSEWSY